MRRDRGTAEAAHLQMPPSSAGDADCSVPSSPAQVSTSPSSKDRLRGGEQPPPQHLPEVLLSPSQPAAFRRGGGQGHTASVTLERKHGGSQVGWG